MTLLLTFFVLGYTVFILVCAAAWRRLPEVKVPDSYKPQTLVTVLIPVRNEASNITALLQDLEKQQYPKHLFEVLVIDDHSEDNTCELVKAFAESTSLDLKLLQLEKGRGTGKKSAIAFGLKQAKGELVVQTDGDCRVTPNWLLLHAYTFNSRQARFISGPVLLQSQGSFFGEMQVAEFASLIGSGAAAIGLGKPNMCNGANLSFHKPTFELVKGFSGNENLASGDDEFLMHKIQAQFPGSVYFLLAREATVLTPVQETVSGFLAQRTRWASKWKHYQNRPAQAVGALVFGANLLLLAGFIGWLSGNLTSAEFWPFYIAKSGADFVFLFLILRFLGRKQSLIYLLPWQLVYIPYVIYCALAGLRGTYNWKGRKQTNP